MYFENPKKETIKNAEQLAQDELFKNWQSSEKELRLIIDSLLADPDSIKFNPESPISLVSTHPWHYPEIIGKIECVFKIKEGLFAVYSGYVEIDGIDQQAYGIKPIKYNNQGLLTKS